MDLFKLFLPKYPLFILLNIALVLDGKRPAYFYDMYDHLKSLGIIDCDVQDILNYYQDELTFIEYINNQKLIFCKSQIDTVYLYLKKTTNLGEILGYQFYNHYGFDNIKVPRIFIHFIEKNSRMYLYSEVGLCSLITDMDTVKKNAETKADSFNQSLNKYDGVYGSLRVKNVNKNLNGKKYEIIVEYEIYDGEKRKFL